MNNPPDLPALIAKAKEPYLWSYCVVRGLVAALEATAKENERLTEAFRSEGANRYWEGRWRDAEPDSARRLAELRKRNTDACDALKTTLAALLIEYVAARKEGHIKDFPPRAQAIVRRAEAALGVE